MTPSDLVELLGKEMAERAKQAALALSEGESEIMRARGLILIDTRYEVRLGQRRRASCHRRSEYSGLVRPVSVTWRNGKKITPVSPPPWPQEGTTQ